MVILNHCYYVRYHLFRISITLDDHHMAPVALTDGVGDQSLEALNRQVNDPAISRPHGIEVMLFAALERPLRLE